MRHDPAFGAVRGKPGDYRKWDGSRWLPARMRLCTDCREPAVVAEWECPSGDWTCERCTDALTDELVRRRRAITNR